MERIQTPSLGMIGNDEKVDNGKRRQTEWMPSKPSQSAESRLQPKIIKIPPSKNRSSEEKILNFIKASWYGQVYRSYSRRFGLFQQINLRLWYSFIFLNRRLQSIRTYGRHSLRWRQLIKHSQYAKREMNVYYRLTDASIVKTPTPKVYPLEEQAYLTAPHDQYCFPEIGVSIIDNATIYGGTNLIFVNKEVICHDLYDFQRDYTSEELHRRTQINPESGLIKWLVHDVAPAKIPAAGVFVDACAANYAHWLTEVLPRIAIFCADDRFKSIPVIVNDYLHPNLMSSMFAVIDGERKIIVLPTGRALKVGKLYLTSPTGYVPFERRSTDLCGHSHGMFSPEAFFLVRKLLKNQMQEQKGWPKHIFVRRNSGIRRVVNAYQIEMLLRKIGYVVVAPEKLTFSQQVQLFANAKTIVGSSGGPQHTRFCKNQRERSL